MHRLLLSFVDIPSLSRINASNLPQQALMELFIQDLSDVSMAKDEDGSFYPIEQWSILTMGSDGHVLRIFIESDDDSYDEDDDMWSRNITRRCFRSFGKIHFQYAPASVTDITICSSSFSGTLQTSSLPRALRKLDLSRNDFKGPIETKGLPRDLERMYISHNGFTGELDLDALPTTLFVLSASFNKLLGTLSFHSLPPAMITLNLAYNNFAGDISFCNVPKTLKFVFLEGNQFTCQRLIIDTDLCFGSFRIEDRFMGQIYQADGKTSKATGFHLVSTGQF